MTLEFRQPRVYFHEAEKLEAEKNLRIVAFANGRVRDRSHTMTIQIERDPLWETEDQRQETGPSVYFYLNKNEAIYLMNFLKSFVNEQDVDPDAED